VICKYEQHACTNFQLAADFGTANNQFYRTTMPNEHQASSTYTSAYIFGDVTGMGRGNQHGDTSSTANGAAGADNHAAAAICDDTSVRVYHSSSEPLTSREVLGTTGHHCKMVSAVCTCKCHSSFHHGYNPAADDRFEYNCGAMGDDTDMDWRSSIAGTGDDC
jgi:hypothetical protein